MTTYKFLGAGAQGRFSGVAWPTPEADGPGAWLAAGGSIEACRHGVHACREEQLLEWIDDELWEVELDGRREETETAVVAERGRLLRPVLAWNADTARAFVDDCVDAFRRHGAAALERAGHTAEATELLHAQTPGAARALADSLARAGDDASAAVVAYAVDCLLLAGGARPDEQLEQLPSPPAATAAAVAANVAFVTAHAAGCAAPPGGYSTAFAGERRRQLDWLRSRVLA